MIENSEWSVNHHLELQWITEIWQSGLNGTFSWSVVKTLFQQRSLLHQGPRPLQDELNLLVTLADQLQREKDAVKHAVQRLEGK